MIGLPVHAAALFSRVTSCLTGFGCWTAERGPVRSPVVREVGPLGRPRAQVLPARVRAAVELLLGGFPSQ